MNFALLTIILVSIIGGASGVFIKVGVKEIPPVTFTFLRFFIASIFLIPFLLREKKKFGKDTYKIVLFSLLATLNVTLFAMGIKLTTAMIGQVLYTIVPVIAIIFSHFIIKEKITIKKLLGIIIGLIGALIIVVLPKIEHDQLHAGNLIGNILILFGVISFSLYTVYSKRFQKEHSPMYITSMFAITTTVVLSFFSAHEFISNPGLFTHLSTQTIFAVFFVSLIGTFLYYILYQYVIKHASPVTVSMTFYLQPATSLLLASVLLGEKLTPGLIIGAILAFIGAYIITHQKPA